MLSKRNALRFMQRNSRPAAVLTLLFAAAACDQPTEPQLVDSPGKTGFSHSVAFLETEPIQCGESPLADSKSMKVNVTLSDETTAAGVVVSVLDPEHGVLCYGATNADGRVHFANLQENTGVLLSVRDEISLNALGLEIVPPSPVSASLLFDEPSIASNRQEPALVGGELCDNVQPLTWAVYMELRDQPCIVTGESVHLMLKGHAPQLHARVLDASNEPLSGVIVAALSPATTTSSDLDVLCAVLPWVDQQECRTNSNGPALLQSLGLTDDDGRIGLGVTFGTSNQTVVLETIAEEGGQTLFGTLFETSSGDHSLLTSPGMCTVEKVEDSTQPSGSSELDIRSSAHSVGLSTALTDPSSPVSVPALVPVNSTLVVKLNVHVSEIGGTGRYTLQYRLATGGMKTVRASFSIGAGHPDLCTVSDGSGNGLGSGTGGTFTGHCAPNPVAPADLESGRRAYTLFFVLSGVDGVTSAQYDIRTDRDHLDPSRSDEAYLRGGVNFTGLNATSCPVRLNNDGRWIAL